MSRTEADGTPAGRPSLAGMNPSRLRSMPLAWDDAERAALVALLRERPDGRSWPEIAVMVAERGSAMYVWESYATGVRPLFGDGTERDTVLASARSDVASWARADFDFLTFLDDRFPAQLRDVHQVPPVLFARGTLEVGEIGVSVVGSRKASARGLAFARQTAIALVKEGITVVSGLATGIDTSAHLAALNASGRTVAVIGTGIENYYPAANRTLQDRIARDGLVISQFWPEAPPTKHSFPMRNAVMSAFGRATIIVEAGETSGARIQARTAVEHGRPVILTPGVTQSTEWGRAMVGRPGVSVAQDPDQAVQIVRRLLSMERRIDELLSMTDG